MRGAIMPYVMWGILIVIGLLMITIGYYVFPSMITGAEALRNTGNLSEYIAMEPMVGIGPPLFLLGFTISGLGLMLGGAFGLYKTAKGSGGGM
jgi:hypothetical protein